MTAIPPAGAAAGRRSRRSWLLSAAFHAAAVALAIWLAEIPPERPVPEAAALWVCESAPGASWRESARQGQLSRKNEPIELPRPADLSALESLTTLSGGPGGDAARPPDPPLGLGGSLPRAGPSKPAIPVPPMAPAVTSGWPSRPGATSGEGDVETAIAAALEWLAAHQNRDGSWTLSRGWTRHARFIGEIEDGVIRPDRPGLRNKQATGDPIGTGLALAAFLGAGQTGENGRYAETVRRALAWLREEPPLGSPWDSGVRAWALAEAAGSTRSDQDRRAAARAIADGFSTVRRARRLTTAGGAWLAMAVRAGQRWRAECSGADIGLLRSGYGACRSPDGDFGYGADLADGSFTRMQRKSLSYSTAVGSAALLCLEGSALPDGLLDRLARDTDRELAGGNANTLFLMLLHGTVTMRLAGRERWQAWRAPVFRTVLAGQNRDAPDAGAWPAKMTGYLWAGDRPDEPTVFATALGALILEGEQRRLAAYR